MPAFIEARELSKTYRVGKVDVPALRGVSFSVQKGEFVTVVGPSGSGKSTLFYLLGGLNRAGAQNSTGRAMPDPAFLKKITEMLGIAQRLEHRPNELSGGEQQRVALARALINRPAIVLADEPTGNLDSKSSSIVLNMLRQSNKHWGQTVLIITHNPEAAEYGDRIVHMRDGQIVTPDEDPQWSPHHPAEHLHS